MGIHRAARSRGSARVPFGGFFEGSPPALVIAVAVAFVVGVALLDHLTGAGFTLAPFYLLSVLLATWNVGRLWGIVMAGFATVAAQLADLHSLDGSGLVPSWNAIVWFALLVFVVWLLSTLKNGVLRQYQQIVAEEAVADGLRQQNQIKDTLLHAVSHDLKGPLAGVLGAMQTIRRAEQLRLTDAELEDLYCVIEQAGAKAARLVDDLLDLDRLDRGQLQPERRPTDVVDIARRLTAEIASLAGHPVRVEGDEVLVDLDAAKVERIIENLLANAGRHTPPGTPIRVEVDARPNGIVLIVEDEGEGVGDDLKESVFEPFRQGENARGGVGIGLSLVRRFAELHGGTAHVEDRAEGGARFVVTLPGAVHGAQAQSLHAV